MTYHIDQSGKIEQSNRATVVAIANGKSLTIKISAVEKQKLILLLSEINRPNKTYAYLIFSALIFILLQKVKAKSVIIDQEYSNHQSSIKEVLVQLFEKEKRPVPEINFDFVGKKCPAHKKALLTFQKKIKPDKTVSAEEIIKLLISGNKKGWRSRSGRENP